MISTSYKPHQNLQQDVTDYLVNHGFRTAEATYHTVMPREIIDILQCRFTMTALYLRGRADRIAIHPEKEIEFEYECKTHQSRVYDDLTIELLPLAHHIYKSGLGVKCLYCCRHPYKNIDCGFWIESMPPIRVIMIPDRDVYVPLYQTFTAITDALWPSLPVQDTHSNGSGDPFVIIDKGYWTQLPAWTKLIEETT